MQHREYEITFDIKPLDVENAENMLRIFRLDTSNTTYMKDRGGFEPFKGINSFRIAKIEKLDFFLNFRTSN